MRYARSLWVPLLVIATVAFAANVPAVQKLLPAKDAVKGFGIMPNSLQYGKGDDISKIYDGGYELYTKNGVIDAARQMYQRKDDYVEVTVHTMKSPQAALSFLKYWQKEQKAPKLSKMGRSTGFVVTKPNVMAYYVTGRYLTTVSAFHDASRATGDAKQFVKVIEAKVPKSK